MTTKKRSAGGVAYSYIRFSRVEQADGDSLRRQMELTRQWCERSKVTLDESLTFQDRGVSGYTGEHRTNPDRHALAAFLEAVKTGKVRPGSHLVIENLDRLSREHVRAAVQLFLSILDSGVHIVTTAPERFFGSDSQDMTDIIVAVVELSRGHSESARRSERCGQAWGKLKEKAARDRVPVTKVCPAWIEVRDGAFHLVEEKAAVVRRIYQLARDGYGIEAITKKLAREKVKPISHGKHRGEKWCVSYVATILLSRAAYGVYQPMKGKHKPGNPKARQKDGDPVENYFPAAVTADEWHATRAVIEARRHQRGRNTAGGFVNVFKGLLSDARTRTSMHFMSRTAKDGPSAIFPYAFTLGTAPFVSFPGAVFERAILSKLREIDPRELLPQHDAAGDRLLTLSGRLADVESRIKSLRVAIVEGDAEKIPAVVGALRDLEAKRDTLAAEMAHARQEAASPIGLAWADTRTLIDALDAAPDPADARTRLRAALRRVVSAGWVLIVPTKAARFVAVQLRFAGSDRVRNYLVIHRPARSGFLKIPRPEAWYVRDFAAVGLSDDVDFRKPEDVTSYEKVIADLKIESLLMPATNAITTTPPAPNPTSTPKPTRKAGKK